MFTCLTGMFCPWKGMIGDDAKKEGRNLIV